MSQQKHGNENISGGFPVVVRMANGEEKTVKNAADLANLNGQKFSIVRSNANANAKKKQKKNFKKNRFVTIPKNVNFGNHQWEKKVGAILIVDVSESVEQPETHMVIKLEGFEEHPITVTKEWWEKSKPKNNSKDGMYLVRHSNGHFSVNNKFFHEMNFKLVSKPAQPKAEKKQEAQQQKPQQQAAESKDDDVVEPELAEQLKKGAEDDDDTISIVGTNKLGAMVAIAPGHEVQLGEVVGRAFDKTAMSEEAWNNLDEEERDKYILDTVQEMKEEHSAAS